MNPDGPTRRSPPESDPIPAVTLHRDPRVELLDSKLLHAGRIFKLLAERVRLPSGLEQELDVVEHSGAVGIAAQDEAGRLLLVRQYRHALGRWFLELPAGRLEPGEAPAETARRELEEETGMAAGSWRELRTIVPAPGFCSERVVLFHARDLREVPGGGQPPDPDEELELEWRTPAEILGGEVEDAKTLVAAALLSRPAP